MRERTTFYSWRTLDTGIDDEFMTGPETVETLRMVKATQDAILADRQKAVAELKPYCRILAWGFRIGERNRLLKTLFPDHWSRLCPWQRLSHEGYAEIMTAIENDETRGNEYVTV